MSEVQSQAKLDPEKLVGVIRELRVNRQSWEDGAYRSSNKELYALLEGCHKVLERLRAAPNARKALTRSLEALGIPVRSNTSLELKVVRAVFGIENRRIYAYVRVLQTAKNELRNKQGFREWLEDLGGVEEVRRKPKDGPTPSELNKQHREVAEERLSSAKLISTKFKPDDSLQPEKDGDYQFSVALVRVDSDGKAGIVFGSAKTALVRAVLTEAGRQIGSAESIQQPAEELKVKRKSRDEVLASITAFDIDSALAA